MQWHSEAINNKWRIITVPTEWPRIFQNEYLDEPKNDAPPSEYILCRTWWIWSVFLDDNSAIPRYKTSTLVAYQMSNLFIFFLTRGHQIFCNDICWKTRPIIFAVSPFALILIQNADEVGRVFLV